MFVHGSSVERDIHGTLGDSVNLPPDLVEWQKIRQTYIQFPTDESIIRIRALFEVAADLERDGLYADLLITGSLAVGQSIPRSDIDIAGLVSDQRGIDARRVAYEYERGLARRLHRDINVSVNTVNVSNTVDLKTLLESGNDPTNIKSPTWVFNFWYTVGGLYCYHHLGLGIGTRRLGIVKEIEEAKAKCPEIAKNLSSVSMLSGFVRSFSRSFREYMGRLQEHPSFSSLPEEKREQLIRNLEEHQNQFLFYLEYPKFCQVPSGKTDS